VLVEAIRQHAVGDQRGPRTQDVARDLAATACEAQAAQRDERVAAPITEPRIAGDDRSAEAALGDVRVRRTICLGHGRTPRRFALEQLGRWLGPRRGREAEPRGRHEVEREHAGHREVLLVIEAAFGLG
jgi:hypothetical protein